MSADDNTEETTTRITRKGQVTIPQRLREEFGLEAGDELRWESDEDGIVVRKATRSAGRGMLVDETVPEEQREEMAAELESDILEKRRTEWNPE